VARRPLKAIAGLGVDVPEWAQLLARALAFRIATFHLLGRWDLVRSYRYSPAVDAVGSLAR
jgi:hypothetical protein